ncbi:MAG TPA: hypothetical protein PKA80_07010 [Ignavibacteriaceae bacterium]|nr:hypothetical protein [Ignavibacteriaceae bacterium]
MTYGVSLRILTYRDEAISKSEMDCFASLAMTNTQSLRGMIMTKQSQKVKQIAPLLSQ